MPRSRPTSSTGWPSTSTWPCVGTSRPATALRMVDLPQPEGPRKTTISPHARLVGDVEGDVAHRFRLGAVARDVGDREVVDAQLGRRAGEVGLVGRLACRRPRPSGTVTATVPGSPAAGATVGASRSWSRALTTPPRASGRAAFEIAWMSRSVKRPMPPITSRPAKDQGAFCVRARELDHVAEPASGVHGLGEDDVGPRDRVHHPEGVEDVGQRRRAPAPCASPGPCVAPSVRAVCTSSSGTARMAVTTTGSR